MNSEQNNRNKVDFGYLILKKILKSDTSSSQKEEKIEKLKNKLRKREKCECMCKRTI